MSNHSENEEYVYHLCGNMPCKWVKFGKDLLGKKAVMHYRGAHNSREVVVDEHGNLVLNASMQKAMYQMFTYLKFGHLKKGVGIPTPLCIVQKDKGGKSCGGWKLYGVHANAEENTAPT